MSAFHEGTFAQRSGAMGDQAEAKFEEVTEEGYVRFGLNRPPIKLSALPKRLRHAPDFLLSNVFVEVQGVGRDQVVKVKVEKLRCLEWWNLLHPVELFIWDSSKKRTVRVPLQRIMELTEGPKAKLEHFHDGPAFWAIPTADLFE